MGYLVFGFGLAVRTGKPKAEAHSRKNEKKEKKEKKGIFGFGRWEAVRIDLRLILMVRTQDIHRRSVDVVCVDG